MTKFSMLKLSLCAAALALASTLPSQAQAPAGQARIQVPFAFQVGTEHFAPGVYTVAMINQLTLSVRGAGNSAFAAMKRDSNGNVASSKVVFQRVGGQYFLREVWTAGGSAHLTAYETKAEKQALKTEQEANQPAAPTVEIALAK